MGGIWDILGNKDQYLKMLEHANTQQIPFFMPDSKERSEREYIRLYLRQEVNQSRFYQVEEYDLLTYFGDIGGIFSAAMFVGRAITFCFVSRLLQAEIVQAAYRVQRYFLDMSQYYETNKERG